jgi:hypothetical protein
MSGQPVRENRYSTLYIKLGLQHRAQNLKQIFAARMLDFFAARMLYFKVQDRPDVLHK